MDKLKYVKIENEDGSLSDNIPLGVDAENVDTNDGSTVEIELNNLKNKDSSQDNSINNLNNKINIQDNSINNLKNQINSLASGSPLVASSVSEMTDTSKVYVNTTDGNWYYYNGSSWEIGGVYQATKLSDNSVDYNILDSIISKQIYKNSILNERKGLRDGSGILNNYLKGFLPIDSNLNFNKLSFIDNNDLFENFSPKKIRFKYNFENSTGNPGFYFGIPINEENHNKKLIFTAWFNRTTINSENTKHNLFFTDGTLYNTVHISDTTKEMTSNSSYIKSLKTLQNYELIKYVVDLSKFDIGNTILFNIRVSTNINFNEYVGYLDFFAPTFNIVDNDNIGEEKIFDTIQEKFNFLFPNLYDNTKPFQNKKFLILGDSITRADTTEIGWIKYFNEIIKPSLKINVAVNGAKMCDQVENQIYDGNPNLDNEQQNVIGNQVEMVKNRKNQNLSDYQNFDYIIIAAGTNDNPYTLDKNYNNIDSQFTASDGNYVSLDNVDRTTFAGAMRYIYQTLQSLYPNATIIFNTPTQTAVTSTGWWTTTKAYKLNKIIFDICKRLSVKVIDSYRCGICGIYEKDGENGRDLRDGIHPNSNGAKKLGYYNAHSFINQFYTINN